MKPLSPRETEALLERTHEALDECLDALAGFRAVPRRPGDGAALNAGELAMHKGEAVIEELNEVLSPIYTTTAEEGNNV